MNTHHRNDPSSPWGGMGSSGVGSENGIGMFAKVVRNHTHTRAAAYHAYTKMKSTIINYATPEENLKSDDWFIEGSGEVRYN